MNRKLVVTALLAASLVACQANPVSGRKALVLVSKKRRKPRRPRPTPKRWTKRRKRQAQHPTRR